MPNTLSISSKVYQYVKRVRIRSYSGPHFFRIFPHSDRIWRDTEYLSVFSLNAGKCRKNADQNNSEYGPFLRSVYLSLWNKKVQIIQRHQRHLDIYSACEILSVLVRVSLHPQKRHHELIFENKHGN